MLDLENIAPRVAKLLEVGALVLLSFGPNQICVPVEPKRALEFPSGDCNLKRR